jgi:hypothetical protein
MKRLADYTIGFVIVMAHLILMGWRHEKLSLH